jgi:hypothetical protein
VYKNMNKIDNTGYDHIKLEYNDCSSKSCKTKHD